LIPLSLGAGEVTPQKILCLGAHCDDIEIGCGGTLLRWLEERPELDVRWAVFSSDARRAAETRASARRFLGREPDIILTHYRHDLHQDHRLVSELTWNTFRGPLILEYEIPKWDGDLGNPNAYVPLTERHVQGKIDILLAEYGTQSGRGWFEPETFRSLARLRGMEAAAPERYAEAFYARKLVLGFRSAG
jgi:LmbE family N-acetylglucosaminyl deacetylase